MAGEWAPAIRCETSAAECGKDGSRHNCHCYGRARVKTDVAASAFL